MTKNILVYGDSNAWGWIPQPQVFPTQRLPKGARWPDILAAHLEPDWDVICDALPERTTTIDDPNYEIGPNAANGLSKLCESSCKIDPVWWVMIN